jgi:TAG lipase/steryl ester hydrolase/phospholipase A2/LPA acyltransferase
MCKDETGAIVPYHPYGVRFTDGSVENDLPMARLAELFNVNHFIVSQVNPYVLPFIDPTADPDHLGVFRKMKRFIKSETRHRLLQAAELGLFPRTRALSFLPGLIGQKYEGDITIVPVREACARAVVR